MPPLARKLRLQRWFFYICDMSQPASAPEPLPDGSIESAGPIDVVTATPVAPPKPVAAPAPVPVPQPPKGRLARIEEKIKQRLGSLTLGSKVTRIAMLANSTALVIAGVLFLTFDFVSRYIAMRGTLVTFSNVAVESARLPLQFSTVQPMTAALNAIASQPDITGAAVFLADGRIFARSQKNSANLPAQLESESREKTELGLIRMRHYKPVFSGDKSIGTLVVETSLAPLYAHLLGYAAITLLVLGLSAFAARRIASRLQPVVSEPFVKLAHSVDTVVQEGSFTLRAEDINDAEAAHLAEAFNNLLVEIQKRDATINQAQMDLEANVLARTSVLHQQVQDRKHAEDALRDSEMRYRNLFENNPMPMFVVNLETLDFVAVNNASMRHYGYAPEEFAHLSLPAITHGADPMLVTRTFRSGAKSLDAGEWKHRKKNGELIEVQLTAHAIVFAGKVAKIVLANDVTERNRAQHQLDELHKKLVETSRHAGMAEVATGVLHNVGNVLNSVNVSATLLAENARQTKAISIRRIADLLDANKGDLPGFFGNGGKGAVLPGYIATLAQQLEAEQAIRLAEAEQLMKNVAHIKDIVAMQQTYAKTSSVMENLTPESLVTEALRMAGAELQRENIAVKTECPATLPEIFTDRHKILQILINLITNARQALGEKPKNERILRITATCGDGENLVRIIVRDNGCGIAPENMTLIFNHGFTTKKSGHGFGLHSSANAAKEVGGNLTATSDGQGLGAVFTLELPIKIAAQEPMPAI